jgi:hypothetical protein
MPTRLAGKTNAFGRQWIGNHRTERARSPAMTTGQKKAPSAANRPTKDSASRLPVGKGAHSRYR